MEINRKRVARRLVSGLVAGALALGGLAISGGTVSAKTPTPGTVVSPDRIGGSNRYGTAALLADRYLNGSAASDVVIASGEDYPDALAAAALAGAAEAPILLTAKDSLPSATRDWLLKNYAGITASAGTKIYLVGGSAAISDEVEAEIAAVFAASLNVAVKRIKGDDRYATAVAVANELVGGAAVGSKDDTLFIASGASFADATGAAPVSFNQKWPILLTSSGSLSAATKTLLSTYVAAGANASSTFRIVLLGGTSAISNQVHDEILALGISNAKVRRVGGPTRYLTNTSFNNWALLESGIDLDTNAGASDVNNPFDGTNTALVAGFDFADALAAAPFLGKTTAPSAGNTSKAIHSVIVPSGELDAGNTALYGVLSGLGKGTKLYVIGGTSAVPDAVRTAAVAGLQSTDLQPTMICSEGANYVTLVFPKSITSTEEGQISYSDLVINLNPTAVSAGANQNLTVAPAERTTYAIPVTGSGAASAADLAGGSTWTGAAKLDVGDKVTFSGVTEAQSDKSRKLLSAECTVADDAVRPTLEIIAAGESNSTVPASASPETGVFYVKASEAISGLTSADFTWGTSPTDATSVTDASAGAGTLFKVVPGDRNANGSIDAAGTAASVASIAANVVTTSAAHGLKVGDKVTFADLTAGADDGAAYVITVPSTLTFTVSATYGGSVKTLTPQGAAAGTVTRAAEVATALLGQTITIDATGVADTAGNTGSGTVTKVIGSTVAARDLTGPTFTGSVLCVANAGGATLTVGTAGATGLKITMTNDEALEGSAGNGWKAFLVDSPGQLRPLVSIDEDAKKITITTDAFRTKPSDAKAIFADLGDDRLTVTVDTADAWPTTISPLGYTAAGGSDSCTITLTASEYLKAASGSVSGITINGVASTFGTVTTGLSKVTVAAGSGTAAVVVPLAAGSIVVTFTALDVAGNTFTGSISI